MSEYPVGDNGEMVHCLDNSPYARKCYARLEREIAEADLQEKK